MRQIPFDPKKSIIPAFMTPIGTFRVPGAEDLNPELEKEILRRMAEEKGQTRSNVGGWHSMDDLFRWEPPAFAEFRAWIQSAVMRMVSVGSRTKRFKCQTRIAGWANVNGPGQYNANHNHPNCHWSGVYYVRVEDTSDDPLPKAGQLQFYDPRGSINMIQHPGKSMFGHVVNIRPQPGLLVLFPAWLYHSVNPFLSDVQRISIAFNATIRGFETVEESPEDPLELQVEPVEAPAGTTGKKTTRKNSGKKTGVRKRASKKKAGRKKTG